MLFPTNMVKPSSAELAGQGGEDRSLAERGQPLGWSHLLEPPPAWFKEAGLEEDGHSVICMFKSSPPCLGGGWDLERASSGLSFPFVIASWAAFRVAKGMEEPGIGLPLGGCLAPHNKM